MAFQETGQEKQKLKWNRLTKNLCPACTAKKGLDFEGDLVMCPNRCGFKIRAERMQEIVSNILEYHGRDDELDELYSPCPFCSKPLLFCSCD